MGELVRPSEKLTILADKADNRILECAMTARAEPIVTGDKSMLMLKRYQDIIIITLSRYLGITRLNK
jgi:predicted nucleic acid-binding protein